MSNLIEQIMKMENDFGTDGILFQPIKTDSNGAPNYLAADGIIRRISTNSGTQWAFHTLTWSPRSYDGFKITGSGIYGDINDVVKAAERAFGVKSEVREWIPVSYDDTGFPNNLIP